MRKLCLVVLCSLFLCSCDLQDKATLTVYSGRKQQLVDDIIREFEKETGTKVQVSYKKTGLLTNTIQEEGEASPADVFWAQDANALGVLATAGFFDELPEELGQKVSPEFRNSSGLWVPTSGRARVLAYAPDRVEAEELPKSVFDLTDPKWKGGRIGWAPTNSSFQAFVTAMRLKHGDDKTREWLKGVQANEPKQYPKNTPIIEALAAGEIDVGLPNHYYLLRFKSKDPDYPVAQKFFDDGDIGNLVFVAGMGILKTSNNKEKAKKFVEFMLGKRAQQYFTDEIFEYPMNTEVTPHSKLVPLEDLQRAAPDVSLEELNDLEGTQKLLREAGLL